jgi:CheY-like chemotaxis protein
LRTDIYQEAEVLKILLIDDDVMFREMLNRSLTQEGYSVTQAGDGLEAMALLREKDFDIVVTDMLMPDKQGYETIIDIKRMYPEMKIIAMSGGNRNPNAWQTLVNAKRIGADQILVKPFHLSDLKNNIQQLTNLKIA